MALAGSNVQQMIIYTCEICMCKTCPDLSQLDNTIIISGFAAVSSQSFSSPFVSDNNFDNVFGQNNFGESPSVLDLVLTVFSAAGISNTITPTTDSKLVTGDLDSSLANLASNLNFGPAANR